MNCIKCNVILSVGNNWNLSSEKERIYICKTCQKKYKNDRSDEIKEYRKNYYQLHKKEETEYAQKHIIRLRMQQHVCRKKYYQTPKGKAKILGQNDNRQRELGNIFLNDIFDGSVRHHVDKNHIINIPKEIHVKICHNVKSGYNMEIINTYAFFFLLMQNISKF